jgi:hypothetical protein
MSTLTCEVSQNAPSVCLWKENPNRLMSLLEIVDLFNAWGLYQVLRRLELLADRLKDIPGSPLTDEQNRDVSLSLQFAKEELDEAKFVDLAYKAERNALSVFEPGRNASSVATILSELYLDIEREMMRRKFAIVQPDRSQYAEVDQLFGSQVYAAFPSARRDIREAGNCLAVDAGTAAVFHLMRAAEVALRALAVDRDVQYPDASINSKQVGDLLSALDGKLLELRKADAKLCWEHASRTV